MDGWVIRRWMNVDILTLRFSYVLLREQAKDGMIQIMVSKFFPALTYKVISTLIQNLKI